jgi:sec-independent protein translocase protein TatB
MFDIGGWEFAVVIVVAVFVIGPKDLPAALRTFGRVMGRVRSLTTSFRLHVDEMIRDAELEDLRKAADAARSKTFGKIVEDAVDPDHLMRDSFNDAADATRLDPKPLEADADPPTPEPEPLPEPEPEVAPAPAQKPKPKPRAKAKPKPKTAAKNAPSTKDKP